jgi:hypothetical protein
MSQCFRIVIHISTLHFGVFSVYHSYFKLIPFELRIRHHDERCRNPTLRGDTLFIRMLFGGENSSGGLHHAVVWSAVPEQ